MAFTTLPLPSAIFWIVVILLYLSLTGNVESTETTELRKASSSETNVFNFLRLVFMRMVYGFANMIGIGGFLEDFAGGIFAPPTAEYDGFGFGGDDDYKEYNDYDY